MLGTTPAELLPIGGRIDSGTSDPATPVDGAPGSDPACHEPAAAPSLLRGRGGVLVGAGDLGRPPEGADVDSIVAQLAPILSHASLAASFAREATPDDPVVRAAYARVWDDLSTVVARRTIRRARIRAVTTSARRR